MAPTTFSQVMAPPLLHLLKRKQDPNNPPLASVFALVIDRALELAQQSSLSSRSNSPVTIHRPVKRQQQVLVIPTTYANINSSPDPGAVVGITLGAVLGFILVLFFFLLLYRAIYGGGTEIIEEEVIRRHQRSHSKHSRTASSMSEVAPPPVVESRRTSRVSRRESRRTSTRSRREPDTVIVEEEMSEEPAEVIVEEEDDDIVEVIEEHSPEPPPRRKSSRRSGFRTIDPDAYGGGDAPSRRISRHS